MIIFDFFHREFISLITVIICVFLAALFAVAETSITSFGTLKAKHLLDESDGRAKHILFWLNYPNKALTTILVYTTAIHILASAVATSLATRYFQDTGIGVATGALTLIILVFGEIVPKSIAKANADKIAPTALYLIQLLYRLTSPLVFVFAWIAAYTLKKISFVKADAPPISQEEIEFLINMGKQAGVFEDFKKDMISGVFEFDETKVREIMTPRTDLVALDASRRIEEALRVAVESGHSRIPIYDKRIDNIVGVVFSKDLLQFVVEGKIAAESQVTKIMRQPFFAPESKLIMEVFKDLKRTKNHMAVVIDEYGGTAGVVTMEDILEEIVGEIQDEFDVEEAAIAEISPGVYDVRGSMNIDEFFDFFEIEKSEGVQERAADVDTIAGWLTQMLGHLPQVGQSITIGPLVINVAAVQRHRIRKLRVQRKQELPPTQD